MIPACDVHTSAWYGDRLIRLSFPNSWDARIYWPDTPPPLSDAQISEVLANPAGQPPMSELARGKARPLIIVDDLTRPTPVDRILPAVLLQLERAGIPASQVSIMIGTGTHPPPTAEGIRRKLGPEASASGRVLVHDCTRNVMQIGRTSFGTPIIVNREVLASDFLVGIGGVYPQHSAGFGGGSKLVLSVLGKRSIIRLHYGHRTVGGSYEIDNNFRRDLDEMARRVGLRTSVSANVDASRQIVRMVAGDHFSYYPEAVAFARKAFVAPLPGDADVVISNAYPSDVSLTFMRSKGIIPLLRAGPKASRIAIAACGEGAGHHGLFPFVTGSRWQPQLHMLRTALSRPGEVPGKAASRFVGKVRKANGLVRRQISRTTSPSEGRLDERPPSVNPIWVYRPGDNTTPLPPQVPGMKVTGDWEEVLHHVREEQGDSRDLRVAVYPCAPLQVLELAPTWGQSVGPAHPPIPD